MNKEDTKKQSCFLSKTKFIPGKMYQRCANPNNISATTLFSKISATQERDVVDKIQVGEFFVLLEIAQLPPSKDPLADLRRTWHKVLTKRGLIGWAPLSPNSWVEVTNHSE